MVKPSLRVWTSDPPEQVSWWLSSLLYAVVWGCGIGLGAAGRNIAYIIRFHVNNVDNFCTCFSGTLVITAYFTWLGFLVGMLQTSFMMALQKYEPLFGRGWVARSIILGVFLGLVQASFFAAILGGWSDARTAGGIWMTTFIAAILSSYVVGRGWADIYRGPTLPISLD